MKKKEQEWEGLLVIWERNFDRRWRPVKIGLWCLIGLWTIYLGCTIAQLIITLQK